MKRKDIKRYPLADSVITALEPETKVYSVKDSSNLYLRVKPSGSKSWVYRYKSPGSGKWALKGLGGYPAVSGKLARKEAVKLSQKLSEGENIDQKKEDVYTLEEISKSFVEYKKQEVAENTIRAVNTSLKIHIIPSLGKYDIKKINRLQCKNFLQKIQKNGKLATADNVRKHLRQVFSWAVASGYCEYNPVIELNSVLVKHKNQPRPFLVEKDLKSFLNKLDEGLLSDTCLNIVKVLLFTMARPGMVRRMEWSEIDVNNQLWSIEGSKMKMGKAYKSPLSNQVMNILFEIKSQPVLAHQIGSPYVFNSVRNLRSKKLSQPNTRLVSEVTLARAFRTLGYTNRMVPHGVRHTGSTLLNEHGWDSVLIESQLAHTVKGIEGIYNKAEYVEKRREMMQWYCDYLDSIK